jgi:hypothetical protein
VGAQLGSFFLFTRSLLIRLIHARLLHQIENRPAIRKRFTCKGFVSAIQGERDKYSVGLRDKPLALLAGDLASFFYLLDLC